MEQEPDFTREQVEEALRWKRQQLADHEAEWKTLRQHSKDLTLKLITEHGVSMSRAAELSGHHRNTVMIWLKIHNAETKAAGGGREPEKN